RRTTRPACRGVSCGSAAMSALLLEVVVDGGAVYADGLGDLGDAVLPLAVRADGLVHAAHRDGLPGVQLGLAAAGAPVGPGGVESLAGALDDQFADDYLDNAVRASDGLGCLVLPGADCEHYCFRRATMSGMAFVRTARLLHDLRPARPV